MVNKDEYIPRLRSVRWRSTTDGRITTWMRVLTPPMTPLIHFNMYVCMYVRLIKNLVNFGPVPPKFCRRVCAGRATRWATYF